MSIEATRAGFEASFEEAEFYNKQTQDEKHLKDILATINVKPGMRILDLGCGSGYLTFPIAKINEDAHVIGLDIVTDTLEKNTGKALEMDIKNLKFISYDGITFPFENDSFDLVVTRYALHHFPQIKKSIREVARVLSCNGLFFVSDPRPNDCDITRFVDDYMQLKKDGHIKFYTKDEWVQICRDCNMNLIQSFDSEIRFPKKKSTAEGFEEVLARHEKSIIDSYHLTQTEDEIWVTEQVNNLLFQKQ
ncbi:MAG: class I SAM-dependent methyltransferase [Lachnospira sp.]